MWRVLREELDKHLGVGERYTVQESILTSSDFWAQELKAGEEEMNVAHMQVAEEEREAGSSAYLGGESVVWRKREQEE